MSDFCTICDSEADSRSIAVALQYDKDWGDGNGNGFHMSLFYIDARLADTAADAVFKEKTWAEIADYKVDWGKLKDRDHAVTITGLEPGTPYSVYTRTENSSTNQVLGIYFTDITTKS